MPDLNVYLIIITGETSAQHCELERLGRSIKVHVPARRARYRHVPIEVPSRSLATSYLTLPYLHVAWMGECTYARLTCWA